MVLVGGALVEHGSCDALRATGHAFAKLMDEYVPPQDAEEAAAAEAAGGAGPVGTLVAGGQAPAAAGTTAVPLNLGHKEADGELILDETKQAGNVGLKVYKAYFVDAVGGGYFNLVSLLVLSVGAQIGTLLFDFWLSVWSDAWSAADQKSEELSSSDHSLYMGTYVGLGAASIAVGLARYLNHARHSATAAQGLFAQLLHGVLHAPIEFFDVTPIGRILNRFSRDTDSNDTALYVFFSSKTPILWACQSFSPRDTTRATGLRSSLHTANTLFFLLLYWCCKQAAEPHVTGLVPHDGGRHALHVRGHDAAFHRCPRARSDGVLQNHASLRARVPRPPAARVHLEVAHLRAVFRNARRHRHHPRLRPYRGLREVEPKPVPQTTSSIGDTFKKTRA